MAKNLSRRDVLAGSAAVAAGMAFGTASAKRPQREAKIDGRLRFGIIGCGGKGESGMAEASNFGDIVAIADVDANNRSKGMLLHPRAAAFDDYRVMLDA